ncbi:RDD family protein [Candidatus Woesearchaeota archaeon]|nr:RDD family protein [Candidatus Woesearchaeota archaeon]
MKNQKEDPVAQYQAQLQQLAEQPSAGRRTIAFLFDLALLSFTIIAPLSAFLEKMLPKSTDFMASYTALANNATLSTGITVLLYFIFILILLYFTLCEYFVGQTAGKRWMNLKVTDLAGSRPTFFQALTRNLVFLPIFPFMLFWIIDPLYLLFSGYRLSEQLSKTKTIAVTANYMKQQIQKQPA